MAESRYSLHRRLRKHYWKHFKSEYAKCREQGGSIVNSAGYSWFASRPIKRKRKAPWNLIDPEYAPGYVARRSARLDA